MLTCAEHWTFLTLSFAMSHIVVRIRKLTYSKILHWRARHMWSDWLTSHESIFAPRLNGQLIDIAHIEPVCNTDRFKSSFSRSEEWSSVYLFKLLWPNRSARWSCHIIQIAFDEVWADERRVRWKVSYDANAGEVHSRARGCRPTSPCLHLLWLRKP